MVEKGAVQVVSNQNGGGYLSNLFLFEKKGGEHLRVINMIQLKYIPYHHFIMDVLYFCNSCCNMKLHVQAGLEYAYFSISSQKDSQKMRRF